MTDAQPQVKLSELLEATEQKLRAYFKQAMPGEMPVLIELEPYKTTDQKFGLHLTARCHVEPEKKQVHTDAKFAAVEKAFCKALDKFPLLGGQEYSSAQLFDHKGDLTCIHALFNETYTREEYAEFLQSIVAAPLPAKPGLAEPEAEGGAKPKNVISQWFVDTAKNLGVHSCATKC